MPEQTAHVTSVEALEAFRTSLLLYVSKARPTVEEVSSDVLRTRLWLENDQRMHWETQVRRRAKALEQAEQALSSARISNLREASTSEQMAVRKAKHALEEAEAKLKVLKYWNREFENRAEPLVKQLEKLHTVLSTDMLQANAYLSQAIDTLSAYAEIAPPSATPTSNQPGSENPGEGVVVPEGSKQGVPPGDTPISP
jgi:hypothetical protein